MKRRLHPWLGHKQINPLIRHWQRWGKYAYWCSPVGKRGRRKGLQEVEIDDYNVNVTEGLTTTQYWDYFDKKIKGYRRKQRGNLYSIARTMVLGIPHFTM